MLSGRASRLSDTIREVTVLANALFALSGWKPHTTFLPNKIELGQLVRCRTHKDNILTSLPWTKFNYLLLHPPQSSVLEDVFYEKKFLNRQSK
jgi:hypothetical protein